MRLLLENFLFYVKILRVKLIPAALLSILVAIADSLGIMLFIPLLMDNNSQTTPEWVNLIHQFIGTETTTLILGIISVFCLKYCIVSISLIYTNYLYLESELNLRSTISNLFSNVHWNWLTKNDAARLSSVYANEMTQTITGIKSFIDTISSIFLLLFYLTASLVADSRALIILSTGGLLLFIIQHFASKYIGNRSVEISSLNLVIQRRILELARGIKYLKSTAQSVVFAKRAQSAEKDRRNASFRLLLIQHLSSNLGEPVGVIMSMLYILINIAIFDESIAASILPLFFLYRSVARFNQLQSLWARSSAVAGSTLYVRKLISELQSVQEENSGRHEPDLTKPVFFRKVGYQYDNMASPAVSEISLKLEPNKITAIVGKSGAGKTTVIDLLTGLCSPTSGDIFCGNQSLRDTDINLWRHKIGLMTQDTFLVSGTIEDNITLFTDQPKSSTVQDAIKLAHVDDFVGENSNISSKSKLGSEGTTLSGGQAQRLALAREIFRAPDLLILDEGTSALDTKSEQHIRSGLLKLKEKAGIVIVAHRFSLVEVADYIYVMEKGRIVAEGNWKELMETSDLFRQLAGHKEVD